jgi:hypothetical protein
MTDKELVRRFEIGQALQDGDYGRVMRLANDLLPDDDRRKITGPRVAELRTLAAIVEKDRFRKQDMAKEFLDGLEELIPPLDE